MDAAKARLEWVHVRDSAIAGSHDHNLQSRNFRQDVYDSAEVDVRQVFGDHGACSGRAFDSGD